MGDDGSTEPSPGDTPTPGTLVGRYVVGAPIGAGAMGVVVHAYDPELDRNVALKLLRTTDSTEHEAATARMVREAQALARLSHPHIVRVHDVGELGDRMFVALDLIEGGTLRTWLATPRSVAQILEVFEGAGRGLAAAHDVGLVHRDFKPDNVLVGADGRAHVTDFGLVRVGAATRRVVARPLVSLGASTVEVTAVGTILGTPAYMAPEQLEGGEVDERSDQFAFCVALYEAVYGARPFAGATVDRLASAVLRAELAPTPGGRRVPSWLRRVLLRGLSRYPGERFASMHELLAALGAAPRRRRWLVAGATATAAVTAAVAIGSWTRTDPCAVAQAANDAVIADTRGRVEGLLERRGFDVPVTEQARRTVGAWLEVWSDTHAQTCRATEDRRERSVAALASARSCLHAAHAELLAILEAASVSAVSDTQVVRAVGALGDPAVCRDVVALDADGAADAPDEATVAEVARLRAARALGIVPAMPPQPEVVPLVTIERALVRAQASTASAPVELHAALIEAERIGSAQARARGWIAKLAHLGRHGAPIVEVARTAGLAHAAIDRAGNDAGWHADVDLAHGEALIVADRAAEAIEVLHRAAAGRARRLGPDHPALAEPALALGRAYRARSQDDRALAQQLRALALVEAGLGAEHPSAATIRLALAETLERLGEPAAAERHRVRGRAVLGERAP